jgi:hypothetical protein
VFENDAGGGGRNVQQPSRMACSRGSSGWTMRSCRGGGLACGATALLIRLQVNSYNAADIGALDKK